MLRYTREKYSQKKSEDGTTCVTFLVIADFMIYQLVLTGITNNMSQLTTVTD